MDNTQIQHQAHQKQSHLEHAYPEVYGPAVQPYELSLGWKPMRRDVHLREDGVGGNNITNSNFSYLGTYTGRFTSSSPCTTAFTMMFKIMGDVASPCVTTLFVLNSVPRQLPAVGTIIYQFQ